jgi:hypothetical protein
MLASAHHLSSRGQLASSVAASHVRRLEAAHGVVALRSDLDLVHAVASIGLGAPKQRRKSGWDESRSSVCCRTGRSYSIVQNLLWTKRVKAHQSTLAGDCCCHHGQNSTCVGSVKPIGSVKLINHPVAARRCFVLLAKLGQRVSFALCLFCISRTGHANCHEEWHDGSPQNR